jgi:beta-glucuronidase
MTDTRVGIVGLGAQGSVYAELVSGDMVPNVDLGAICAVDTGDLPTAEVAWEEELEGWASQGKPIIITECGADTYPGLRSLVAGSLWTEEYQEEYLDMNHRVFDRIDAVVGEQVRNFADFTTTSGIMRVGGNKKGVFTRDRQPKAAAYALRRRWRKDL